MKKVFIHKKKSRGLFIPDVGVCPYCRTRNFEGRIGGGLLSRLFSGTWWCRHCHKPFRSPVHVRQRIC